MPKLKKLQGFAAMSPERRREISSIAGKKSQEGKGHKWTQEEAKRASLLRKVIIYAGSNERSEGKGEAEETTRRELPGETKEIQS